MGFYGGSLARPKRLLCIFLCLIATVYLFFLVTLEGSGGGGNSGLEVQRAVEARLSRVMGELEQVRDQSNQIMFIAKQIRELRESRDGPNVGLRKAISKLESRLTNAAKQIDVLETANGASTGSGSTYGRVGANHEYFRRRAEMRAREIGYLVDAEVTALMRTANAETAKRLKRFQRRAEEQQHLLLDDLESVSRTDGAHDWRLRQLKRLGSIVQERIVKLQNPPDCYKAHKLVCNLNKGCGFGCQAHHVLYCLILSYATGRTLVLESVGWRYSSLGWSATFEKLSQNCTTRHSENRRTATWGAPNFQSAGVVEVSIIDALRGRPDFLPQAVPQDLLTPLQHLHGAPFVWFAGQLLTYVMRPNYKMRAQIRQAKEHMKFQKPIVGVHIRRTDKVGTEAAFHAVDEYMLQVERWYRRYALSHGPPSRTDVNGWRKRIFLATDDYRVLREIRQKYPDYEVATDSEISKSAVLSSRYSDRALRGVILDIVLLAESNFLVCTFSSQVCRVAYELMQPEHVDRSAAFRSLDDIYYFGGQNANYVRALMDHEPLLREEIPLRKGDLIKIAGNHWNGLSKGTNTRTGQMGLFPSYKTEFVVTSAKMGNHPKVTIS